MTGQISGVMCHAGRLPDDLLLDQNPPKFYQTFFEGVSRQVLLWPYDVNNLYHWIKMIK